MIYNEEVKFVAKHRVELLLLFILIAAYFMLRLPNLTLQPIFADEAIYIRWAQVMKSVPSLRYLPMTDGKTPLFMWVLMPFFNIFSDPLFAGRFLSVICGLGTLLGVFFLTGSVFNKKAALVASALYVFTPYTLFFDRMAIVDSMLSAFTVWSAYFAVRGLKFPNLNLSVPLGITLGGAWLTKTPGYINLAILPVSILAWGRRNSSVIRLILFFTVAILIALVMYNSLRLLPEFHRLSLRNSDYVFSPSELSRRPFDPFIPHMRDIFDWFPKMFTWPILISVLAGIVFILREKNKPALVVFLWGLIPIIVFSSFLKTFTTRYILLSVPLLLVTGGYTLAKIPNRIIFFLLAVVLAPAIHFDYLLLTRPADAPLPKESRRGYFEEWTAGYGLKQIAEYLIEQKKNGSLVVGTEGYFGTLPDGLFIYLDKAEISVISSHPTSLDQLKDALLNHQVFFVANGNRIPSALDQFPKSEKIMEYEKAKPLDGSKQSAMVLYRILP